VEGEVEIERDGAVEGENAFMRRERGREKEGEIDGEGERAIHGWESERKGMARGGRGGRVRDRKREEEDRGVG
jgi:hypothetical protein